MYHKVSVCVIQEYTQYIKGYIDCLCVTCLLISWFIQFYSTSASNGHEMSHRSTQDPDSPDSRYMDSSKCQFSKKTEAISLDEKIPQSQMEDPPETIYESPD